MIIDISSLLHKKSCEVEYDLIPDDVEIILPEGKLDFSKDILFNFKLQLLNEIITIVGIIKTQVMLQCSRCAEEFAYDINLDVFEEFTINKDLVDEDIALIINEKIDISRIVSDNILINLPIAKVCKEGCKGLCHKCGTNLNKEKCDCHNEEIDDRLKVLQEFLKLI
ncbi:MAG: DUF177 domain-containing protein [Oscillospiraceae bacterium]|nr:DUF177 domain-containing protein [Oscillospiraceae bacterium]